MPAFLPISRTLYLIARVPLSHCTQLQRKRQAVHSQAQISLLACASVEQEWNCIAVVIAHVVCLGSEHAKISYVIVAIVFIFVVYDVLRLEFEVLRNYSSSASLPLPPRPVMLTLARCIKALSRAKRTLPIAMSGSSNFVHLAASKAFSLHSSALAVMNSAILQSDRNPALTAVHNLCNLLTS